MNSLFKNIKNHILSLSTKLPTRLKRFCENQMLVILIFILFGDSFKYGQILGLNRYNWIQGHFSDIGLTAQFTTALYYIYGHKQSIIFPIVILPPFSFTLYELTQYPNSDPIDIACYFLGSMIAIFSLIIYKHITKIKENRL